MTTPFSRLGGMERASALFEYYHDRPSHSTGSSTFGVSQVAGSFFGAPHRPESPPVRPSSPPKKTLQEIHTSLSKFLEIASDESSTNTALAEAHLFLPHEFRKVILERFSEKVIERGKKTITDPQYGEHVVTQSPDAFQQLELACTELRKCKLESRELENALDSLEYFFNSDESGTPRERFSRLSEEEKNIFYYSVYIIHATEKGVATLRGGVSTETMCFYYRKLGSDHDEMKKLTSKVIKNIVTEGDVSELEPLLTEESLLARKYLRSLLPRCSREVQVLFMIAGISETEDSLPARLHAAIKNDKRLLLREVLKPLSNDTLTLEYCARTAISLKNFDVFKLLFEDGRALDQYQYYQLLLFSIDASDERFAGFLLSKINPDSDVFLDEIIEKAIKTCLAEHTFNLLTDKVQIYYPHLLQYIATASRKYAGDSNVKGLLQGRALLERDRTQLLLTCARNTLYSGFDELNRLGPLPHATRDSVLQALRNYAQDADIERRVDLSPDQIRQDGILEEEEPSNMMLTWDQVEENPEVYLHECCFMDFPSRFSIIDSEVLDAGGPTKQFISTLFTALQKKQHIPTSHEGLPRKTRPEDTQVMMYLGRMFSLLFEKNLVRRDKLVTGEIFSPEFFKLVKLVSNGTFDSNQSAPERLLGGGAVSGAGASDPNAGCSLRQQVAILLAEINPDHAIMRNAVLRPHDEQAVQEWMDLLFEEDSKKALQIANATIDEYLEMARAFYIGARPTFKETIKATENPKAIGKALLGSSVTKEMLKQALSISFNVRDVPERNWAQTVTRGLEAVLERSDEKWRIKFLKSVTGNTALSPGQMIKIRCYRPEPDAQGAPPVRVQTCFNTLLLPIGITEEGIEPALAGILEGSGFEAR